MFHVKQSSTMSINQCLICGNTALKTKLEIKDYFLSKEDFQIIECENCGFLMTAPRPTEENIGAYYDSTEYISHSNTKGDLISNLYQMARSLSLRKKYRLIQSISQGKTLLDIGCGTGEFLHFMDTQNYDVMGIEPNKSAREQSINNYSLNVGDESKLKEFPNESFDIISLWHVLEHVYSLNERMECLYRLLKRDGKLILALPNFESGDAKYYGKYWAAYDVPRHLYHFNEKSIRYLLDKHGFKLEQIKPMTMDSFYVSLLSEQYKNNKKSLIKAFYRGLASNLQAIKTNQYSSLIYIISKK